MIGGVTMKQAMNFRLSMQTIAILTTLEQKMHASKTAVVEEALRYYAEKKMHAQSGLLDFAGVLNENDADEMLNTIQKNKHNKKTEIKL